jgi:AcrR family transcriptional regulator
MAAAKRPTRPRKQQERSARTKRALVQATIDLMVERGYSQLTVTEVAKRAGVSSGARVHHFTTKNDLILAALEHSYQESILKGRKSVRRLGQAKNPIRALFANLMDLYFDPFFLSSLEVVLNTRMEPAMTKRLHRVIGDYHTGIREVWVEALLQCGFAKDSVDAVYATVLDTVRGMAMTSSWNKDQARNKRQARFVEAMLMETYAPAAATPQRRRGAA